jgi:L,D-peptidoglycan transpeptidase YkuD (ErfK/YbiS/YcfS/YnhG family)
MAVVKHLLLREGRLEAGNTSYRAAIGRAGVTGDKREGDGMTPRGTFRLRGCYFRPDRVLPPKMQLPMRELSRSCGWCDDPAHPLYNQFVKLPFAASHEDLWRDDHVYDLILVTNHNTNPIIPGKGSAVFIHIARDDYAPTAGCLALSKDDLLNIVETCSSALFWLF